MTGKQEAGFGDVYSAGITFCGCQRKRLGGRRGELYISQTTIPFSKETIWLHAGLVQSITVPTWRVSLASGDRHEAKDGQKWQAKGEVPDRQGFLLWMTSPRGSLELITWWGRSERGAC